MRRPYSIALEAGRKDFANVFSGSMLPVQVRSRGQPTVMLKDVGAGLRLRAHPIPGRGYRLDVSFSDGFLVPAQGAPAVGAFQCESRIVATEGETVTVASVVDPQTGEAVEAEPTLERER